MTTSIAATPHQTVHLPEHAMTLDSLHAVDPPERRRIFATCRSLPDLVAGLRRTEGVFIPTRVLLAPGERFDLEVRVEGTDATVTLHAVVCGRRPGAGLVARLEGEDLRVLALDTALPGKLLRFA